MRLISLLILLLIFSLSNVHARSPKWFEIRINELNESIKIENPPKKIDAIGSFLSIGSNGLMDSEQKIIFNKAQSTLLAIPVHATYYKDKIEAIRAEALENHNMSPDALEEKRRVALRNDKSLVEEGDYRSYATEAFTTLKYLPSSETVAVLGHFLNDPEGRTRKKGEFGQRLGTSDSGRGFTNSEMAVVALINFGIERPPINMPTDLSRFDIYPSPEQVDAWKDWWNEIAAGKRTYRFIGSEVEFGPNGPVSKDKLERIHQDRQRDAERANGKSKPGDVKAAASVVALSRPLPLAGILATAILAVSGGWYFFKRRKAA